MKSLILAGAAVCMLSFNIHAASYHQADQAFIKQSESLGVSQSVWDSAEYAAVSFPHAYKYTSHYRISRGLLGSGESVLMPEQWQESRLLDITQLTGVDADGEHSLDIILRDRLKNHSMVVLKGNKLAHQHFYNGLNQDSTHLDMSVTKSFTAMLAAVAVDEGKLDMSKKVEYYLPEMKGTAFEGVTIQEVADMRSGLNIPTPEFLSWDPRLTQSQDWHGKNDSGLHGAKAYLKLVKERKYPIGEKYQYQDPNTELLGMVVEKAAGVKLADYLEAEIWKQVGAENDVFWMSGPDGYVSASGGLNMSTRDLARIGKVILNDGKNYVGEQVIPKTFLDDIWAGNESVRSAWAKGKESHLAEDGWYKDQFRVINIDGHKVLYMVGIHGQILAMEKSSGVVIAMNGGYTQTETPRMANLIFYQVIPAILEQLK
ncbi:serine hydrolase domain-containing protein [Psychromonas aquimarina]|uniref:serine hydrolase domain-containing protein n=1 Tax=Psychromonas aquimarina TaxID=444919 RepID=UPI00042007C5|nr:serine hydrolase [Psychromonas aquimarina]